MVTIWAWRFFGFLLLKADDTRISIEVLIWNYDFVRWFLDFGHLLYGIAGLRAFEIPVTVGLGRL
jgi:hypothetical protein